MYHILKWYLPHIIDWLKFLDFSPFWVHIYYYVLQSLSIRDFDNHATRIVGKYEVHMQHIEFIIFYFLALSHFLVPYVDYKK